MVGCDCVSAYDSTQLSMSHDSPQCTSHKTSPAHLKGLANCHDNIKCYLLHGVWGGEGGRVRWAGHQIS